LATPEQLERLKAVVPAAQFSARQFRVPASVTLAQWMLESAWGTSGLTVKANNCFGIKRGQQSLDQPYLEFPTAEYIGGRRVIVEAEFVHYVSVADSFKMHARLLAESKRYAPAMAALSPNAFAILLQVCGYSTNPRYGVELAGLMHEYELQQYDVAELPTPIAAATKESA
jgi:flagellum-specific peptidoglycan hydrolase FlgJ